LIPDPGDERLQVEVAGEVAVHQLGYSVGALRAAEGVTAARICMAAT